MKLLRLAAPLLLLPLSTVALLAAARPQPAVWECNFADGMRHGWESYPLAQDAGYDPSLEPAPAAEGGPALARRKTPNRNAPLAIGFIRRFDMTAGPTPTLELAYQLEGEPRPFTLEIQVFHQQTHTPVQVKAQGGAWSTLRVTLPVDANTRIDAISVTALLEHAWPGRTESFLIRNPKLSALRVPSLHITGVSTLWDDDRRLHYAQRAVAPGDSIRIPAGDAAWRWTAPNGTAAGQGKGGEAVKTFSAQDAAGIWTLALQADAGEAKVLFLLRQKSQQGVLFDGAPMLTPAQLQAVQARAAELRRKVRSDLGRNINEYNDWMLLPGLPSYFALLQPPSELALLDSLLYASQRGAAELAEARKIVRDMAAMPRWVHPWFEAHGQRTYYPVGITAANLAMSAELLGAALPDDERIALEEALLAKSIRPAFEEYVMDNRVAFHTSNWISHAAGGALIAALECRRADVAGYALGLYQKEADHIAATYTEDGSYGEGISYHRFDAETASLVAYCARRQLGQSVEPAVAQAHRYMRYALFGEGEFLDQGDSHSALTPLSSLLFAAWQGQAQWLAALWKEHPDSTAAGIVHQILFGSKVQVQSNEPEWPRSAAFPERGNVVFRDGWKSTDVVMSLRAGPNYNHNHADQGSVQIAANGEEVLTEAGYSDYYKDPFYQPYVIQAAGHNTLLVDGNPESQVLPGNRVLGGYPRFESFLGRRWDFVDADLSSVYPGAVSRYHRVVLHAKGGPVVVFDQVRSDQPHRYSVVWHPAHAPRADGENGFVAEGKNAQLHVRGWGGGPRGFLFSKAPLPFAAFEASETRGVLRPSVVTLESDAGRKEQEFVTVLSTAAISDAEWRENDRSLRVGGMAVREADGGFVATDGDEVLLVGVRQWSQGGRSFTASVPVQAEWSRHGEGWRVIVESAQPATVRLQGFGGQVRGPGSASREGEAMVIAVPAGRSEWVLE